MRDNFDMPDMRIATLQRQYRSGSLTPTDTIAALRKRIVEDASFNIWIEVLPDDALAPYLDALTSPAARALPLYGIPFAIKDNIDLTGVPTTAGCPAFAYTPQKSAFAVQRLIDAGAIPIGKTNLDQFATGLVGVRSPYGPCRNALLPEYIAGGSSSGSAVAVARGHVSFALGTDTAGSGRVPAALNGIVGWKPSRGRVSTLGVVPACPSLDCVSTFTQNVEDAATLMPLLSVYDADDPWSLRHDKPVGAATVAVVGVPRAHQRVFFGASYPAKLFTDAIAHAERLGVRVVEVDIAPLLEAGTLLYGGPWAGERRLSLQRVLNEWPETVEPVIRDILAPAETMSAMDAFVGMHRLARLRRHADVMLDNVDALLLPTVGGCSTIAEVVADPIALNSRLGHYTTFANLLDLAAMALPAGTNAAGLPFGISVLHRAGSDARLLGFALRWCTTPPLPEVLERAPPSGWLHLAVCGAHMRGLPLNHQLVTRRGEFVSATSTAPTYRFYALPGSPARPGLVRTNTGGASVAVEIWRLPETEMGSLLGLIPAPLGLGSVALKDGRSVPGFLCEAAAVANANDITEFGGWRAYVASLG